MEIIKTFISLFWDSLSLRIILKYADKSPNVPIYVLARKVRYSIIAIKIGASVALRLMT